MPNVYDQKGNYEAALALREKAFKAKERMRKRLAALSFSEKIKMLEKLRDRSLAIAAAGLRATSKRHKSLGTK